MGWVCAGERVNESRLPGIGVSVQLTSSGRADGRLRLVGTALLASRLAARG